MADARPASPNGKHPSIGAPERPAGSRDSRGAFAFLSLSPVNERHERETRMFFHLERAIGFLHLSEYRGCAGVDEPAADFQLLAPRERHVAYFGGGDDAVESADRAGNVRKPGRGILAIKINPLCQSRIRADVRFSGRATIRQDLDRVDPSRFADELGKERRLPSGPAANVHDAPARLGSEEPEHEENRVGLGYRLPLADRQRRILIGAFGKVSWHKILSIDAPQRLREARRRKNAFDTKQIGRA